MSPAWRPLGGDEAKLPSVLLVESNFVLRRTIASVAADLALAAVDEALGPEQARPKLHGARYDALILGGSQPAAALQLLADIRAGKLGSMRDVFAVVLLNDPGSDLHGRFADIGADVTLRRPYRVSDVFGAIAGR